MRKRALVQFTAMLLIVSQAMGSFNTRYNWQNFQQLPIGIKQVVLTPLWIITSNNTTNLVPPVSRSLVCNAAGSVTFSNMIPGAYRVEFFNGSTLMVTFTNVFGTNVTGNVNAVDYISVPTNTSSAFDVAYTQAAADARFVHNFGDTMTGGLTNSIGIAGSGTGLLRLDLRSTFNTFLYAGTGNGAVEVHTAGVSLFDVAGAEGLTLSPSSIVLKKDTYAFSNLFGVSIIASNGFSGNGQGISNLNTGVIESQPAFTWASAAGNHLISTFYSQLDNPGSITSATYKVTHRATADIVGGIQVLYGNSQHRVSGSNWIQVESCLELTNGAIIRLYFGGQQRVSIPINGFALSDPIGLNLRAGTPIYSRTFVVATNSSGSVTSKYPVWAWTQPTMGGFFANDGYKYSSNVVDAPNDNFTANLAWAYIPQAIYGRVSSTNHAVMLIGDSIGIGAGNPGPTASPIGLSILTSPFNFGVDNTNGRSYVNLSHGSDSLLLWNSSTPELKSFAWRAGQGCRSVIIQLGVNDLVANRTFTQISNDLMTIWSEFAAGGVRVFQTTITPVSSSTNSWADTNGQTASFASVRVPINNWIRTVPAPLTGMFDVAATSETSSNSGLWIVPYTADGIHPNTSNAFYFIGRAIDPRNL